MTLASPAPRTAASNGKQLLVAELARAEVGRGLVEPALGESVADQVLGRRERRRRGGRRPGARGRRRSRARPRGTGPRRRSPRSGPSAGRGSMSRTGASAWRAPVASIRRRMVAGHRPRRASGSNVAAAPIDCWKHGASAGEQAVERLLVDDAPGCRAASPRRGSAGSRCRARPPRGRRRFVDAGQPGDLADAVAGQRPAAAPDRAPSRAGPARTPRASRAGRASRRSVIRASRSATRASIGSAGSW